MAVGRLVLRRAICACAVLAAMMGSAPARSAEWSAEPTLRLKTEFNDNIELSPFESTSVWSVSLTPDVRFNWQSEIAKVTGGFNVSVNRYPGESRLDTVDHALILRTTYGTERDAVGFNVDWIRDSTLASELAETGVALQRRQRRLLTASPSWTHAFTPLTQVAVSYGYTDVRYDDKEGTALIDYDDHVAGVAVKSLLSERDTVTVNAYADRYRTHPESFKATTYGVQAGWDRAFTETMRGALRVGYRRTDSRVEAQSLICNGFVIGGICFGSITVLTSTVKDRSSGYTLHAGVEKQWERSTLNASISRDLNPSGSGTLIETDRVGVGWSWQYSETVTAYVNGAAYRSRYVSGVVPNSDSRYFTIEPRVSWRMSERWVLDVGYRYAHQQYEGAPSARANVAYASIVYTWPRIAASR